MWTKALTSMGAGLALLMMAASPAAGGGEKKAAAEADPALVAKGAKLWAENCGRCHNLRPPTNFSDDGWEVTVTHMRVRANLPGKQAEAIKAFLKSSNNQ